MAKERTCFCCLKHYEYCAHGCKEFDPAKTWMYLVHDERCLDVYNTWQQYRGKEITKEDAAKVLKALNVDDILKTNSPVVPVLKEILDIKDEPKVEPEIDEEIVEEEKKVFEKPAENKHSFNNQKYHNKK